jgi:serine protease Do
VNVRSLVIFIVIVAGAVVGADTDEVAERTWLGVYLGETTDRGVEIVAVVAGGPAHLAGLQRGDILTSLGAVTIEVTGDVARVLKDARPGAEVTATLLRDGKPQRRTLELSRRPDVGFPIEAGSARTARAEALRRAATRTTGLAALSGITLAEIPDELRVHYGAPRGTGALVTRVTQGSVAAGAGVAVGDILTRIGPTAIRSPDDLAAALAGMAGRPEIEIAVVRGGKPLVVALKIVPTPIPDAWRRLEQRDGVERSVRIRLLESELTRLEQRIREIREELERLEDRP